MSRCSPTLFAAKLPRSTRHISHRSFSRNTRLYDTKLPSTAKPPPPRKPNSQQLPLLPLVFIFCLGAGSFHFLAKSREGVTHQTYTAGDKAPADKKEWPGRRKELDQNYAGTR
ncbi:hypothetical protein DOTSEDRAFT_28310 [Dothistroma septosporum NZE10]|uniref:Uncharacterized protein n=1 Tax=Dothistroma septosporum (strain NZE10 / CBS 128990) TaxID=675120 RepID=M2YJP3_DOTSN|nr:hypothetical protein DOTSEDRAFT_28310 [Dothistroma septosporum NZE10]